MGPMLFWSWVNFKILGCDVPSGTTQGWVCPNVISKHLVHFCPNFSNLVITSSHEAGFGNVTLSYCSLNWNLSNKWRYLVPEIAFQTFEILESLPHIFIVHFILECGCSTLLHSFHVLSLVWFHHFNLELGSFQLPFILRSTFVQAHLVDS
jgi:hypothetical protein